MKRTVVFAHYDKDNIVDDYVIYYLKALKEICSCIIFVSCNPIKNKDCLEGIADYIIDDKHNEYDFGSYKRGFFYLKENNLDTDELIFANDSCYGPVSPLQSVFEKMSDCDFWGITKNKFGIKNKKHCIRPHLQSYFLVFKKSVINSQCFYEFISSIKQETSKFDVITNYEIGLSEFLEKNNFKSDFYLKEFYEIDNPTIKIWKKLVEKSPFIKCNALRYGLVENLDNIKNYPIELIEKNLKRTMFLKDIPLRNIIICTINILPRKIKRLLTEFISKI